MVNSYIYNPFGYVVGSVTTGKKTKLLGNDIAKDNNRYLINSYNSVIAYLKTAGIPDDVKPYAAAQVLFETNGLKSRVSKSDLNLSGIKWINKPYQNATRGSKSPEGDYYAHFKSYADWARDLKRILSIGGATAAINAEDLEDYVKRLKEHGYFTGSEPDYYKGLVNILTAAGQLKQQQSAETLKAAADYTNQNWWEKLNKWEKGGVITAGVLVGVAILKR